jgi:hypothetical protein
MSIVKNEKILRVLFFLAVSVLAVAVWYSPIIFKGYATHEISREIILARNYYETGVFADQNNLNITLASSLIKADGHPLVLTEYLGAFFYSKIFKLIGGVPAYNDLILTSIVLYALILFIFSILVLRLFGFKIAMIFSLIYMFLPFIWGTTYCLEMYEFCFIFWSLFFVFYFWADKRQDKWSIPLFVISGIFLVLSGLSKEVTLVFALALFIYLFFKKKRKELFSIFIPFTVLLVVFWLPAIINGTNRYVSLLKPDSEEAIFTGYFHVFPDPYTYYFEKDQFLEQFKNQDLGLSENLEIKKNLVNFGLAKITIVDRLKVGTYILIQHFLRFFSLQEFGGPFIFLFLILGFLYLKKRSEEIYGLFKCWLIISFLVFSYVLLAGRSHLMDFSWSLVLVITMGLIYLIDILKEKFDLINRKSLIFELLIIGLVIYHLILVNHIVLGARYEKDSIPRSMAYADLVNKLDVKNTDVIAIPADFPNQIATLNYFINKSFVIFKPETIKRLYAENKLKKALEAFNVKYILGYSDDVSKKVTEQAKIMNIASDSLKFDIKKVSENKSFFMNLVR